MARGKIREFSSFFFWISCPVEVRGCTNSWSLGT